MEKSKGKKEEKEKKGDRKTIAYMNTEMESTLPYFRTVHGKEQALVDVYKGNILMAAAGSLISEARRKIIEEDLEKIRKNNVKNPYSVQFKTDVYE